MLKQVKDLPVGAYICKIEDVFCDGQEWVLTIDISHGEYTGYFSDLEAPYFIHFSVDEKLDGFSKIVDAVLKLQPKFLDHIENFEKLLDMLCGQEIIVCFIKDSMSLIAIY